MNMFETESTVIDAECSKSAKPAPEVSNLELNDVRRLIAPLSKEQLIELIATASMEFPEVLKKAKKMVAASPASRRLMIRNIAFSTEDEAFNSLFRQFGEIDDAAIVRSKSGHSKGYGFVTCRSPESVDKILKAQLSLDGRNLLAKLAGDPFSDFSAGGVKSAKSSRRKLFIRNLADSTVAGTLKEIFEQYGDIEECVVVADATGKSRGYGFVTFDTADAAIQAVQEPQRIIDGRIVFVAFATPTRIKGGRENVSSDAASLGLFQGQNMGSLTSQYGAYMPTYPVMDPYYGTPTTYAQHYSGISLGAYGDYVTSVQALRAAQRYANANANGNVRGLNDYNSIGPAYQVDCQPIH